MYLWAAISVMILVFGIANEMGDLNSCGTVFLIVIFSFFAWWAVPPISLVGAIASLK
jgi:hypothetical protein